MPTVYAAFDSHQALTHAVEQLQRFGFSRPWIRHDRDDHFRAPPLHLKRNVGVLSTVGSFFAKLGNSAPASLADLYEDTLRRGGSVLAVDAATAVEERTVQEILRRCGAVDAERYGVTHIAPVSDEAGYAASASSDIEPIDRAVAVGGLPVLVYSNSGSAVASEADFQSFEPGNYEIREQVEVMTLTKTARVVEELSVNKSVRVYIETIEDMLRSTTVESIRASHHDSGVSGSR